MDITESTGTWRVGYHTIENRKTGEVRSIKGIPSANALAYMTERSFTRKTANAFATGVWV